MTRPASEVYEIVLTDPSGPKSWLGTIVALIAGAAESMMSGSAPANPGGMIISVVEKSTGNEMFRHIEEFGDDEGHLLDGLQTDLDSMSVDEFVARWVD